MALGSLVVELSANIARFQSDMGKAQQVAEDAIKRIDGAAALLKTTFATLGAGFISALTLDAVKDKIEGIIASTAGLERLAERTGATVEGLSALSATAKLSNTDTEALATGLQKLSKSVLAAEEGGAKAETAFARIGISIADLKNKRPDEIFLQLALQLDKYQDGVGKTATLQELLGKSGANLGPVLKDLAAAGQFNVKVIDEQAHAAEEYEKNIRRLSLSTEALYRQIGLALVPTLNAFSAVLLDTQRSSDGIAKSVKTLADDGAIEKWARNGALAIAVFVETLQGIFKLVYAIGGSFQVVGKDIELFVSLLKFGPEAADNVKRIREEREALLKSVNARYDDVANFDSRAIEKNLRERFASIDLDKLSELYGQEGKKLKLDVPPLPPVPIVDILGPIRALFDELGKSSAVFQAQIDYMGRYGRELKETRAAAVEFQITQGNIADILKQLPAAEAEKIRSDLRARAAANDALKAADESVRAYVNESRNYIATLENEVHAIDQQVDALRIQNETFGFTAREITRYEIAQRQAAIASGNISDARVQAYNVEIEALRRLAIAQDQQFKIQRDGVEATRQFLKQYAEDATNSAKIAQQFLGNVFSTMENSLVTFLTTGKFSFHDFANSIIVEIARIEARLLLAKAATSIGDSAGIFGVLGGLFGSGAGGNIVGSLYAAGGDPPIGRVSVVGESGPELFVPRQAGTILPNNFAFGRGGAAPGMTFNISIDARGADSGVEQKIRAGVQLAVQQSVAKVYGQITRNEAMAAAVRSA